MIRRALATALLTPTFLLVLAAPSDAATRYVRDGSYINHKGVRIALCIRQVSIGWGPFRLWDSRGLPVQFIGRCPR